MSEDQAKKRKPKSTLHIRAEGIAHDLDNALTAALAHIALARRGGLAPEDAALLLSRAEDGILRARDLTRQLRSLDGPEVLKKVPCSVASIIADTVGLCRLGPGVACECSLPDRLWTVEADAGQIGQVIQNLLLNAEQAMPGGGTIRVRAENVMLSGRESRENGGGAFVKVSVEDEGTGLPAENVRRIFEPYFSTKGEGRGLGLARCLSIVERHRGHIRADSGEEGGARFHVYLPAPRRPSASGGGEKRGPGRGRQRILVIDDDEMIRTATGEAMKWMGYDVRSVGDGGEGVRCYQKAREERRPFQAVLLDLTLPEGPGGKETMEAFMEMDPEARVILFSARSEDPVCRNYRDFGFRGIIEKPFELDDLHKVLRQVMKEPEAKAASS